MTQSCIVVDFFLLNSCVNPILYAFLSDNFRKSFRRIAAPFLTAVCGCLHLSPSITSTSNVGGASTAMFGGGGVGGPSARAGVSCILTTQGRRKKSPSPPKQIGFSGNGSSFLGVGSGGRNYELVATTVPVSDAETVPVPVPALTSTNFKGGVTTTVADEDVAIDDGCSAVIRAKSISATSSDGSSTVAMTSL